MSTSPHPPYICPSAWGFRLSELPRHTWTSKVRQIGDEFHLDRFVFHNGKLAKGFAWYIKAMDVSCVPPAVIDDYLFRDESSYIGDADFWKKWRPNESTPLEFIAQIQKNNIYDLNRPETKILSTPPRHIVPYNWKLRISPRTTYTTQVVQRRYGKDYDYRGFACKNKMELLRLQQYVNQALRAGLNLVPYFWQLYHASAYNTKREVANLDIVALSLRVGEAFQHTPYLPRKYIHPSLWTVSWNQSLEDTILYTPDVQEFEITKYSFLGFVSDDIQELSDLKSYLCQVHRSDQELCQDYMRVTRYYAENQRPKRNLRGKTTLLSRADAGGTKSGGLIQQRCATVSPPLASGNERSARTISSSFATTSSRNPYSPPVDVAVGEAVIEISDRKKLPMKRHNLPAPSQRSVKKGRQFADSVYDCRRDGFGATGKVLAAALKAPTAVTIAGKRAVDLHQVSPS